MPIPEEKLRKVSDRIFQEGDPPEDGRRPSQWRRSLNLISLPLKNLKIVTGCRIHDANTGWDEDTTTEPLELAESDISEHLAIIGTVDEDKMRDTLYFAVESKEEKGLFFKERVPRNTNVSIELGKPSEGTKKTPAGLYRGTAIRMNYEPGEDALYFNLPAPREQFLSLVSAIRADPDSTVEVSAFLLSFTYEVDDALREYYHRRDIILDDFAPSLLCRVGVTSKIGEQEPDSQLEHELDGGIEDLCQEEQTHEQEAHKELSQALLSYLKPLNHLVAAIWVLTIVIALSAIFGQ